MTIPGTFLNSSSALSRCDHNTHFPGKDTEVRKGGGMCKGHVGGERGHTAGERDRGRI